MLGIQTCHSVTIRDSVTNSIYFMDCSSNTKKNMLKLLQHKVYGMVGMLIKFLLGKLSCGCQEDMGQTLSRFPVTDRDVTVPRASVGLPNPTVMLNDCRHSILTW